MRITTATTASVIGLLFGATAAFAQVNSPVGENRVQGQLSPEQAEIISDPGNDAPSTTANAPSEETVTKGTNATSGELSKGAVVDQTPGVVNREK